MNFILFDDRERNHLLPLTFLRPCALIRCGILNMQEKWNKLLNNETSFFTSAYLRKKYITHIDKENLFINATVFPNLSLIDSISGLKPGQALISNEDILLSFSMSADEYKIRQLEQYNDLRTEYFNDFEFISYDPTVYKISRPWDIFAMNGRAIEEDFDLLTKGRESATLSGINKRTEDGRIFIELGAKVDFSVINASTGPVYIGKNAEIMENCAVRGPFALCEESVLKMGAKIYGPTTIGPHCKVGGEVNNSVFFGYSNKAHDGFLGNSVIAEWCNLGADTNNSNLKNTYDIVKLWSYPEQHFVSTGLQFCGLIMGDHSKSSINTMFNTGTVVGVSANIFGDGFPRNFIPSFSWGGAAGLKKFNFQKAVQVATAVFERRGVILSDCDIEILKTLYDLTD